MKKQSKIAKLLAKMLVFFAPKYCVRTKTLKTNPNAMWYLPSSMVQHEMLNSLSEAEISQRHWSGIVLNIIYSKGIFWNPNAFEFSILAIDIEHVRKAYAKGIEFSEAQVANLLENYRISDIFNMSGKAREDVESYLRRKIVHEEDYSSILTVYRTPELNGFYKVIMGRVIKDDVNASAIEKMINHLFAFKPKDSVSEYGRGVLSGYYSRLNTIQDDRAIWLSLAMKHLDDKSVLNAVLNKLDHILAYLKQANSWRSELIRALMKVVEKNCNNFLVYRDLCEAYPFDDKKEELVNILISCSDMYSLKDVYRMVRSKLCMENFVKKLIKSFPDTAYGQHYVSNEDSRIFVELVMKHCLCTEALKKDLIHALVVGKKLSEAVFANLSEEMQKFATSVMEEQSQRDFVINGHEVLDKGSFKLLPSVEAFMFSRKEFAFYWKNYLENQELSLEGFKSLIDVKHRVELGADKMDSLVESYISRVSMDECMYRLLMSCCYSHIAPRFAPSKKISRVRKNN